eukprot:3972037-Prymnesium_polylepis.1
MEVPNASRWLSSHLSRASVEIGHELAHESRGVAFAYERQHEFEAGMVVDQDECVVMSTARANEWAHCIA